MRLFWYIFRYSLVLFIGFSFFAEATGLYTSETSFHEKRVSKYNQDWAKEISKKLNEAVNNYPTQYPLLKKISDACGGCDIFKPSFDDYVKENLPVTNYGTNIIQYLTPEAQKSIGLIKSIDMLDLNNSVAESLQEIVAQVDEQVWIERDINSGNNADGDEDNSPYDLMSDIQKIMWLFLKNPPQYDWYVDTMKDDAPGLITGQFQTGQWAQGKTYEIDLASDVASAFGQNTDSSSSKKDTSWSGEDCESGFCTTLDIITNDSYSSNGDSTSFIDANFEEIFGSAVEWLVKRGDKRNIACKWPPPVNDFQSNNDLNLSFKNIFRGLGAFVFWKTPPFMQSQSGTKTIKTEEQKAKETDDRIQNSYKEYNINPDNLMWNRLQQKVEQATPIASKAGDTADNQIKAARILKQQREAERMNRQSQERRNIVNTDESLKNLTRQVGSYIKSFGTTMKDILDISKVWKDKPYCQN